MANNQENSLYYRVIGEGRPVVFLHGFMLSSALWEPMLENVPKGFQLILIDLPGHGGSRAISSPNNMKGITDVVESTINKAIRDQPYDLVGHSLGGYILLELLHKQAPINKGVLLNSNFWGDTPEKQVERNRIIKVVNLNANYFIQEAIPHLFPPDVQSEHIETISSYIHVAQNMSPRDIVSATEAMRDRAGREETFNAHGKLKVIQGQLDHIVLNEQMKLKLEDNPIPEELYFESNSGHMSIVEKPEETAKQIFDFFKP